MPPDESKCTLSHTTDPILFDAVSSGHGGAVYRGLFRGEACFVKLPPASVAESMYTRATFEREVLQLGRLQLLGMPRVLHLAQATDRPYAVFAPPAGQPFEQWLRSRPNERAALGVAIALTRALCQLHAFGYVHADLTSERVFVVGTRTIQLADFGSVHRRIPFDPAPDTHALAHLLQQLATSVADLAERSALFGRIEAWKRSGQPASELLRSLYAHHAVLTGSSPAVTGLGPSLLYAGPKLSQSVRVELAQLEQEFLNEALSPVTIVTAPQGAGKSRLLSDFCDFLRIQGVSVLAVSCTNNACAPFSTIQRLIENHLRDLEPHDAATRARYETALRSSAGRFASRLRLLSARFNSLLEPATLNTVEGDPRAAFIDGLADFLSRYLDTLGRSVVILDDLQHLDASSRMVLARLATQLRPRGQHIVAAMRAADDDNSDGLDRFDAMLSPGLLQRTILGPLSAADVHEVASEFLGTPELSYEAVVEPLSRLSDGTPLCLIHLLEFALEQQLLRPLNGSWHLDLAPLRQTRLPASSRKLIERRLAMLDDQTHRILQAAAIARVCVEPELLARVASVDVDTARATLDLATSEALMLRDERDGYVFVHDCVCDALVRPVSDVERRALHQAVASAMRSAPDGGAADEFALARHLALGVIEHTPAFALATLKRAGIQAARAYDDALTLLFLKAAERAAHAAKLLLDQGAYLQLAEASLRTGDTAESLRYFEEALSRCRPGIEAAHLLGRIAWLHHYDGRAHACWDALTAALRELSEIVPNDAPLGLLHQGIAQLKLRAPHRPRTSQDRARLETLCELYVLCVRVSFESGNPVRGLSALWHLRNNVRGLPPCRVVVDAELLKAFVLSSMGKHAPFRASLQRAYMLAERLGDPYAQARCHQIHHVIAGWRGEIDEYERQAHACLDAHVNHIELGELCHLVIGLYAGQSVIGKPEQGFRWLERACTRVQQVGHAPAMFTLLQETAYTHLVEFGREAEAEDLRRRLSHIQRAAVQPGSYFHLLSFQHRAQRLINSGTLGDDLEALITEWRALGQRPSQAHLCVALYYVHVAHARVHQCLRALLPERRVLLRKLNEALLDLEGVRRMPVIAAHSNVIRACRDFLQGENDAAEVALVRAEQLAREHHGVWVSYAAARLRAHMFKARGQLPSAREQARIAAQLAREYGPPSRLRAICEEFELSEHAQTDNPSTRQHLDALLHIAHASSRELSPRHQAQFVLDELLRTLSAERGFLFMSDEGSGLLQCRAARRHDGKDLSAELSRAERTLVEQVYATGRTALAAPALVGERAGVAVALVLRELVVGVIYLDRSSARGAFSADAVTLIEALANQVPVLLELAHALQERARLELNLRDAQKMEAIGRLAGGIAHDFNNILGTIEFSASCLTHRVAGDGTEDLADIQEAASRGAALTKQLMLFARGRPVPKERVDLVDALVEIEPMLSRMLRAHVQLDLQAPDIRSLHALAEPSQIERLMMNLCRNASDAMPNGGVITVRLSQVAVIPSQLTATEYVKPQPNGYAELFVKDTGHGMNEETRARIFEPFFTTKSDADGTGLGLAIVYAIVQQCEGHIAVVSAPGRGTTFRVYLPLCGEEPNADIAYEAAAPETLAQSCSVCSVCVVDDDESYRSLLTRGLSRAGYAVLSAGSGKDALRLIGEAAQLPELLVTDVQMPGMDGLELARRLRTEHPQLRVLFISGTQPRDLDAGLNEMRTRFLQKPFSADVLLREAERLLDEPDIPCEQTLAAFGDAFG